MINPTGYDRYYPAVQSPQTNTFRGVASNGLSQPVSRPQASIFTQAQDTVELSTKQTEKKGLSTGQKWAIGIGSALAGLVTAGILISRHETSKLKKLYEQNMVFQNLAEKIDFKEAKTVEEGIKFAKDVLKVGEVDKNFTLDAINFANKGLVEVSNANKGKLFIPKKMWYREMGDNTLAGVVQDIKSPYFGHLMVNKKFFEHERLNKSLNTMLGIGKQKTAVESASKTEAKVSKNFQFVCNLDENLINMIKKYKQSPDLLTIAEKRELWANLSNAGSINTSMLNLAPLATLKNNLALFEKNGIKVNVDDFAKQTTEKQSEKLKELFTQLQEKLGHHPEIDIPYISPTETIHHEMGHLQDFAKNLKELDIKQWKIPSFKDAYKEVKAGKKDTSDVEFVDNRWGGLTYKGFKELLEKNPKKFRKKYPDLYEFLTNQETQQTAGRVSSYAQTSIGEFIAEVYGKMVRGEKIPDEVMALYKKYNGPEIPFA